MNKDLELCIILDKDSQESEHDVLHQQHQIKSFSRLKPPCPITASSAHLFQSHVEIENDKSESDGASIADCPNKTNTAAAGAGAGALPLEMLVIPDDNDDKEHQDYNALLNDIHPTLATYFSIVGIIRLAGKGMVQESDAIVKPFALLLLTQDLRKDDEDNNETKDYWDGSQAQAPDQAPKPNGFVNLIPISNVRVMISQEEYYKYNNSKEQQSENATNPKMEIPSCSLCLHRIQPQCVGMSQSLPMIPTVRYDRDSLFLWSQYCRACNVLLQQKQKLMEEEEGGGGEKECFECGMKETLWVCLTCGIVGCGRYSRGHAGDHFRQKNHPYSLELATERIWDYSTDTFVHRPDFLQPTIHSSRPHEQQSNHLLWNSNNHTHAAIWKNDHGFPSNDNDNSHPSFTEQMYSSVYDTNFMLDSYNNNDSLYPHCIEEDTLNSLSFDLQKMEEEAPVKKSIMITEEYEALLRSALEEQAQHYEGEITRLIAELSAQEVDNARMSEEDKQTVESLQNDIEQIRQEVDCLSAQLLESQAQEAGYRAQNKVLLREASIAKACLEQIKQDTQREQDQSRQQIEELEYQVMDLTNNLKMRRQIAQNYGELTNAQIFGTSGETPKRKLRNKKQRHKSSNRK